MANNPKKPVAPTKKHLARMERENLQKRYLMIASGVVLILVVLVIVYGVLNETILKAQQPVAVVNDDSVSTELFQDQTRYTRYTVIRDIGNNLQFIQLLGGDPATAGSFVSQLSQLQTQLETPTAIGQQTLDKLVDDRLIQQEAERRGITVTDEEVEKALQEAFNFFPNGTPTPSPTIAVEPTSTLSPLQMTLTAPTATPVITTTPEVTETVSTATPTAEAAPVETEAPVDTSQVITPTATLAPSPTPTEYTRDAYEQMRTETFQTLETDYGITEDTLRYVIYNSLLREKVQEAVVDELGIERTQEQVWARHILLPDQPTAVLALSRLNAGEDFCTVAAEMSTDTSNKDRCGDLGWFGRGRMVAPFEEAAFALDEVGQISDPVQTDFGVHIIQLLGKEERPLTSQEYDQARQTAFQDWLSNQRTAATIEYFDYWQDRVPTEPTLPPELAQAIQQLQAASQQQPAPVIPTELPQPQPTQQ